MVEVRPQLKLEGYEGLKVTVPNPLVTDQDIQAQLDRLRGNFAELAVVEREAKAGDSVVIDMSATRDGEPYPGMLTRTTRSSSAPATTCPSSTSTCRGPRPAAP